MRIQLRYFAALREALGREAEVFETEAASVGQLRQELIARGQPYESALSQRKAVRAALDLEMCQDDDPLHEGAEVAFFPPVTGG